MPQTIRLAGKHTSPGGPKAHSPIGARPNQLDCKRPDRHCGKWHVPLLMPYETILYDVSDAGVATITLNQPDTRNALSNELLGELIDAFEAARDDEAVRCVVLASSHERVFSSGANLGGFAGEVPLVHKHFASDRFVKLFRLIGELGKPSI